MEREAAIRDGISRSVSMAALAALALTACSSEQAPPNAAAPLEEPPAATSEDPVAAENRISAAPPAAPDDGAAPAPAAGDAGAGGGVDPAAGAKAAADARPAPGAKAAPGTKAPAPPAVDGLCERLPAAEAAKAPGLRLVGSAGKVRFYGRPRELLCSEPGTGGVGECEIVGSTVVRVEGDGASYGLRSRAATATVLRYGPDGVSCIAPGTR